MNHFLKRISAWCLALSLLTVGGFAAAGESENSDADQHSPSETTLTAEEIGTHFTEAAKLAKDVFDCEDVDRDDAIPTSEYFEYYYRVKQADSLEAFRDYCRQYYSEELVMGLTDAQSSTWLEQDGKLYIESAYGLGGQTVISVNLLVHKDGDTRYTVYARENWGYGDETETIYYLFLNNGNWGWDRIPDCETVESVEFVEDGSLTYQHTIERIDRSGTETAFGETLTVRSYYDLVKLTPEDSPVAEKINKAIAEEMDYFFDHCQSFIDLFHNNALNADTFVFQETVDNIAVTINEDYISICQKQTYNIGNNHALDYIWNRGYVFDLATGDRITLPTFLGLDSAGTKEIVKQAMEADKPVYPVMEPDQYSFYVDFDGKIHVTFGPDETGTSWAQDVVLDYLPEPQLISQPEPTLVESESAVCLSAHVYGTDLSYDWEYSDDEGATWVPADCADPVLEIEKENAVKERLYRCTVFNDAGRVVTEPIAIPTEVLSAIGATSGAGLLGDSRNLILIAACAAALLLLLALLFVLRRRRREKQGEDLTVTAARETPEPADAHVEAGPKFCGRCGAPRTGSEAFCARCGRPFRNRTGE